MSSTSYSIEYAKSGRSKCKKCKQKIDKGAIRIGVLVVGGEFDLNSWYHPECFNLPSKYATGANKITPEEFIENILQDKSENEDLLVAHKEEIAEAIATKAGAEQKGSKNSSDRSTPISMLAAEFKENTKQSRKRKMDDDDDDEPKGKKARHSKEHQQMYDLYVKYHKTTADEIKEVLRWNRQVRTGNKEFILLKLIDGEMNGRLARCALCGGRLKFKDETGEKIICSGSFDEDTQMRIPCDNTMHPSKAPRHQPWFTSEPSEEDEKELDRLDELAKGENSETFDTENDPDILKIFKAVENIEWSLSNKAGIKKAATAITDLLTNFKGKKLDLPDDPSKARMEIGATIVANKEQPPIEVMKLLIKKFGFRQDKAEKAKRKEVALEAVCENPKNAPLLMAFQELSELYFKEGNRNAGATYTKVVNAIKQLPFEISESNAKGLGKGKDKVAGIGASTSAKMYEFVTTGTIAKLEEKRADNS